MISLISFIDAHRFLISSLQHIPKKRLVCQKLRATKETHKNNDVIEECAQVDIFFLILDFRFLNG